jgi:hypothetical protein
LYYKSLASCEGLITGGGFESPAEALYLGKKLMVIPMKGQYEQQCNAAALTDMGVSVRKDLDLSELVNWLFPEFGETRQKKSPGLPGEEQPKIRGQKFSCACSLRVSPFCRLLCFE